MGKSFVHTVEFLCSQSQQVRGTYRLFYEVTISDFDDDRYPEIIVGADLVVNNKIRYFSNVYRENILTNVKIQNDVLPEKFQLFQNYPNPFNGETIIRYALPRQTNVSILIYNILGKEIVRQTFHHQTAGVHEYRWNTSTTHGEKLSTGVYFIRVTAGTSSQTIKTQLLR